MATIRQKPSGKWELDFRTGGVRQRVSFDSRREAEDAKRRVVLGLPFDHENEIEAKTLKEGIRFYVEKISAGKKSEANERAYFERLYGALRVQDLTFVHDVKPQHLEIMMAARRAEVSAATINREFNTYRHFFTKAHSWKWTAKNPCASIETVPEAKNPRRVWTPEEFRLVVNHVPPWAQKVLWAMYLTGAGPAELARVIWPDIDELRQTMLLKRYKGSGEERRRYVPISDDLRMLIDSIKVEGNLKKKGKLTGHVFVNTQGHPFNPRHLSSLVRRAVRFNGLPEGTVPYGIRHTVATELLEAGVGEDKVRQLLGHESVRTLIENYAHTRQEAIRDAAQARAKQTRQSVVAGKPATDSDQESETPGESLQEKATK